MQRFAVFLFLFGGNHVKLVWNSNIFLLHRFISERRESFPTLLRAWKLAWWKRAICWREMERRTSISLSLLYRGSLLLLEFRLTDREENKGLIRPLFVHCFSWIWKLSFESWDGRAMKMVSFFETRKILANVVSRPFLKYPDEWWQIQGKNV